MNVTRGFDLLSFSHARSGLAEVLSASLRNGGQRGEQLTEINYWLIINAPLSFRLAKEELSVKFLLLFLRGREMEGERRGELGRRKREREKPLSIGLLLEMP